VKSKRLIINADDFGWTRGITDGILRSHNDGLVTSTSLLVNQPASEYAIAQMRNAPRLGVGIHLNLCSGAPVLPASQVPTLVAANGNFYPDNEMARRLILWRVSSQEIEAEFRAQIQWARERGVDIAHADSHYHVHLYPVAVYAFQRAVLGEGIRYIRSPLNMVSPRVGIVPQSHGGPAYRRLAIMAYMHLLQAVPFRRLSSADFCLVPPTEFRCNLTRLKEGWHLAIGNLPNGCYEFSCHPGVRDGGYPETDNLRERREFELQILTDPELRRVVQQQQIDLINYHAL
jgi:predicted glycoside hydrolase/deacetylase ChbG (UPF0249 family)